MWCNAGLTINIVTCPLSSSPPYLAFPPSNNIDKLPATTINGTKIVITILNFQPDIYATDKQPTAVTKEEIARPMVGPVAFKQVRNKCVIIMSKIMS
jgi:hypothetical protein